MVNWLHIVHPLLNTHWKQMRMPVSRRDWAAFLELVDIWLVQDTSMLQWSGLSAAHVISRLLEGPVWLSSLLGFRSWICSFKISPASVRSNDLRFLDDVSNLSHSVCCIFTNCSLCRLLSCFNIRKYVLWVWLVMHTRVWVFTDLDFILIYCSWCNWSTICWLRSWVILLKSCIMSSNWLFIWSNGRKWMFSFSPLLCENLLSIWYINRRWRSVTLLKSDNKWFSMRIVARRGGFIRVDNAWCFQSVWSVLRVGLILH